VDAGLETPSGEDAADRPRVIAGVPFGIEMRLDLGRQSSGRVPSDRWTLVLSGRMSAPIGAEFAGVVVPATFLGHA
jgi:hypothetical protein